MDLWEVKNHYALHILVFLKKVEPASEHALHEERLDDNLALAASTLPLEPQSYSTRRMSARRRLIARYGDRVGTDR